MMLQELDTSSSGSTVHSKKSLSQSLLKKAFMSQIRTAPKFRLSTQSGKKISKIRWLNSKMEDVLLDPLLPEYFVAGSWGEPENVLSVWKLTIDTDNEETNPHTLPTIQSVTQTPFPGYITDVETTTGSVFGATSSLGIVELFKVQSDINDEIFGCELLASNNLHHSVWDTNPVPATGISSSVAHFVTVGEDGSIYELTSDTFELTQSLDSVDELSICCVEFISSRTIVTGNNGGQVKVWDLRSGDRKPTQTLNHLDDISSAKCIAPRPSQSHIAIVGYSSGRIDLWDLRGSSSEPVANFHLQKGELSEISFHPTSPQNFYTSCQNGDVFHWFSAESLQSAGDPEPVYQGFSDLEANLNFLKYGFGYKNIYSSPFPVNSMSLSRNNRFICAGDSGIMFCTENI